MKKLILFILLLPLNYTLIATERSNKPNIILIVADDLGYADLSMNGSLQIKTPFIDQLAENGITFTQAYVSAPVCSPSRAGMITGRNQVHFGHDNNLSTPQKGFDKYYNGLPLTETTIASRLKKLGYTTGLIGKWHLGKEPHFHPLKRGFDEMWGYTGGGHDYFVAEPNGKGYKEPIECNYKQAQKITYITDDKGDECVDFIKRHKNKPFFLFASFNAPHAPMQAREDDLERYAHVKDKKRRTYCAMVHRLDLNVGRIIDALKEEGIEDNTVLVFLSDNGGPVNSNASINAPLNGQKGILLEGGIRVPFIISAQRKLPHGKRIAYTVSALDLAPTFYALAGGEPQEDVKFDGVNLMPYLSGLKTGEPHFSMKWRFTISAAIREGKWKLIRLPDRLPMLFDISSDISEQRNVALEQIETTKRLLKELGQWDISQPHPLFLEGPQWRKNQVGLYEQEYMLVQPQ